MIKMFEEYGKMLDELVEEVSEKAQPLADKFKEVYNGFKEAIKTADRRGFERAIKMSSDEARRGDHDHDPNDRIAESIRNISYTSPD
jgi:sugar-specific transcriptional regulator TrmB